MFLKFIFLIIILFIPNDKNIAEAWGCRTKPKPKTNSDDDLLAKIELIFCKLETQQKVCEKGCKEEIEKNKQKATTEENYCEQVVGLSKTYPCKISEFYRINEIKNAPTSCSELKQQGKETGLYEIKPTKSLQPFTVLCDMDTKNGGWVVAQKRFDGSQSFDKHWRHYKHGFGDFHREFWLGLEQMHLITDSTKCELLIELVDIKNVTHYILYEEFEIGDEVGSYILNVGKHVGPGPDGFSKQVKARFSTKDLDQDEDDDNCAEIHGGGWWFKLCSVSNLNGHYCFYQTENDIMVQGLEWLSLSMISNAASRMLIRSK